MQDVENTIPTPNQTKKYLENLTIYCGDGSFSAFFVKQLNPVQNAQISIWSERNSDEYIFPAKFSKRMFFF